MYYWIFCKNVWRLRKYILYLQQELNLFFIDNPAYAGWYFKVLVTLPIVCEDLWEVIRLYLQWIYPRTLWRLRGDFFWKFFVKTSFTAGSWLCCFLCVCMLIEILSLSVVNLMVAELRMTYFPYLTSFGKAIHDVYWNLILHSPKVVCTIVRVIIRSVHFIPAIPVNSDADWRNPWYVHSESSVHKTLSYCK